MIDRATKILSFNDASTILFTIVMSDNGLLNNTFFQWNENTIKRSAESYLISALRYCEEQITKA